MSTSAASHPLEGPAARAPRLSSSRWQCLSEYGAKVWVFDHEFLGPTFYRSERALKAIETPSRKTWNAYVKWREQLLESARQAALQAIAAAQGSKTASEESCA